jgi:hypothetical protein
VRQKGTPRRFSRASSYWLDYRARLAEKAGAELLEQAVDIGEDLEETPYGSQEAGPVSCENLTGSGNSFGISSIATGMPSSFSAAVTA